jgi:hypothetical protein
MRAGLVLAVLVLLTATVALGARGAPQKRIVPADQARAKAMLVRLTDLGRGFAARNPVTRRSGGSCEGIDASRLTLTGEARAPVFATSTEFVSANAYVYASVDDSRSAWTLYTSSAGRRCTRVGLLAAGGRLERFGTMSLPASAGQSFAIRATLSAHGYRSHFVIVALRHGRGHTGFVHESVVAPPSTAAVVRLASRLSGRMAKAMRGAS